MKHPDETLMLQALGLALAGRGAVEPNPMVGAVVTDTLGTVVGKGWHERYGDAHAEVNALRQAGGRARGGTLYVTLEPCCHHGKTPPCTEAILASGVTRVVVAMRDPFPAVNGGGISILKNAGIEVELGLGEADANTLNAPYLKLLSTGRPWVHAKWAMTLDGKIATRNGESKWITNDVSRDIAHAIRGRMDAILVGRGTVAADDPLLTARPAGPRVAARVVVTASGSLPRDCQLTRTAKDNPVIVFTQAGNENRLTHWSVAGAEVIALPGGDDGLDPDQILRELGRRRFTNVLLEGGPGLIGVFADAGAIDEVHAFIAPKLFGSTDAPGPVAGNGVARLMNAMTLNGLTAHHQDMEGDVYLHGRVTKRGSS